MKKITVSKLKQLQKAFSGRNYVAKYQYDVKNHNIVYLFNYFAVLKLDFSNCGYDFLTCGRSPFEVAGFIENSGANCEELLKRAENIRVTPYSSVKLLDHELLVKTQAYNKKFLGKYSYVAKAGYNTYFDNRLLKKLVNIIGDVTFNNELKDELKEKPLVFYFEGYSKMFKLIQSPLRFKNATELLNKCEPLIAPDVPLNFKGSN